MFRYEHPDHLYLLAAVPLLALLVTVFWFWRKNALAKLGNVERIMPGFSRTRFLLKTGILAVALILLSVAWANPQRGMKKQTATQRAADVFIALDISQSMLCEDLAPNRLELAKVFAQKLVQSLEGERIGLIFFAGNAFLQMPLSTDYVFTIQSIQSAEPDLITEQGTALGAAIKVAHQSFSSEPGGGRALILITDGEDHDEDAEDAAKDAFGDGIFVYTLGAGTIGGGPIPTGGIGDSRYKRDEAGEIVLTRMNEVLLHKISAAGGGQVYNISQGDGAVSSLKREISNLQKRELEVRSYAEFESWYQWFLLPALLLLGLEKFIPFGKKKLIPVHLVVALVSITPLSAQSAHKSLRNGDRKYDQEQYKEAEKHYRDAANRQYGDSGAIYNLGNSLYQQGKWEDAASRFTQAANSSTDPAFKADAFHNLGNALLKQHKFAEAIKAYENSLRLRPGDAASKQNLQMAKKKLKEEEQQRRQQQEKQEENRQQEQQQEQEQQQSQDRQPQNSGQESKPSENQPQPQGNEQQNSKKEQQTSTKLKREEAQRLLERAIGPEDRKNAKKYREQRQQPKPGGKEKDW